MKCPYCQHEDTQVLDTRVSEEGDAIRRRRRCANCDKRFTTYERVELNMPAVVKKNGSRQREVISGHIGELVMRELKRLDKIAYIRFASVYKSFEDVTEFQDAIAEVGRERKTTTK